MGYLAAVQKDFGPLSEEARLKENALGWWSKRRGEFPIIAHVARSVLAPGATSAASERTFGDSSAVCTKGRNRISANMLEVSVLVRAVVKKGLDLKSAFFAAQEVRRQAANARRAASMEERKRARMDAGAAAAAGAGAQGGDADAEEEAEERNMEARVLALEGEE